MAEKCGENSKCRQKQCICYRAWLTSDPYHSSTDGRLRRCYPILRWCWFSPAQEIPRNLYWCIPSSGHTYQWWDRVSIWISGDFRDSFPIHIPSTLPLDRWPKLWRFNPASRSGREVWSFCGDIRVPNQAQVRFLVFWIVSWLHTRLIDSAWTELSCVRTQHRS